MFVIDDKDLRNIIQATISAVTSPLAFITPGFKNGIANESWDARFITDKIIADIIKSKPIFDAWLKEQGDNGPEEKFEYEETVSLPKGQRLPVKFTCRPFYWDNKLRGAIVSADACVPEAMQTLKEQCALLGKQNASLMAFIQPLTKTISTLLCRYPESRDATPSKTHLNKYQLRDFIQNVPVACAMFDTQMNYIMMSEAWHKVTIEKANLKNYPHPEDMIGKNHYEISHIIPKSLKEVHSRCILYGDAEKSEGDWYRNADGCVQWHRWECFPWYEDNNEIGGAIIFVEDITEKKNTEKLLERMKNTNALLEYFADICSHDLKQPVRTIGSFTQILAQEFGHTLDEKAKGYLDEIQAGAKRLYGLIDSILAYTKVDIDVNSLTPVSIEGIIQTVQADLTALIKEKKGMIKYKNLPVILSQKAILYHVFQNLISNSLKFSSFKPPLIEIDAKHIKGYWRFHVKDNGIGIPSEYHQNIFEMHWQYQKDRNFSGSGSGIGLAVCKRVIEALEGNIWVESSSPQGTIFAFTLPDNSAV